MRTIFPEVSHYTPPPINFAIHADDKSTWPIWHYAIRSIYARRLCGFVRHTKIGMSDVFPASYDVEMGYYYMYAKLAMVANAGSTSIRSASKEMNLSICDTISLAKSAMSAGFLSKSETELLPTYTCDNKYFTDSDSIIDPRAASFVYEDRGGYLYYHLNRFSDDLKSKYWRSNYNTPTIWQYRGISRVWVTSSKSLAQNALFSHLFMYHHRFNWDIKTKCFDYLPDFIDELLLSVPSLSKELIKLKPTYRKGTIKILVMVGNKVTEELSWWDNEKADSVYNAIIQQYKRMEKIKKDVDVKVEEQFNYPCPS